MVCYYKVMEKGKDRGYWFKRRRYGYGWTPVTWQGWSAVASFLTIVLVASTVLKDTPGNSYSLESLVYLTLIVLAAVSLVVISVKKGPSAKWRWGSKATDNPEEDY